MTDTNDQTKTNDAAASTGEANAQVKRTRSSFTTRNVLTTLAATAVGAVLGAAAAANSSVISSVFSRSNSGASA